RHHARPPHPRRHARARHRADAPAHAPRSGRGGPGPGAGVSGESEGGVTFVLTVPCPTCQRRLIVRFETDGSGRVVEHVAPCPACAPKPKKRRAWALRVDVERRRAGICQRCPMPVTGKPKVALYCDRCRKDAQAEARARHQAKVGNKHSRAYYYRHREKILERERRRYQENPAERERRNAYKREWRRRNR